MRYIYLAVIFIFLAGCKKDKPTTTKTVVNEDQVLTDLAALIEKSPEDASLYFDRAKVFVEQEDYDAAIEDLEQAIELDSLQPQCYHLLADVYMDYYRSKDALIVMETVAAIFPERIPTLLKLSETQLILKKYHASLLTVAQIMTISPDNAEAHFMKGMNFRGLDEKERAINAFQAATELNPDHIDAWLIAGDLHEEMGNPIALDYYEAAISVKPDEPTSWHSKAFYLQNNGREQEAIDIYEKIITIDKNYVDAYLNAGILYMTMDSLDQATEQFVLMSNAQPQNHQSYYYRGLIKQSQNDIAGAKELLQTCLNLNPEFVKAKKALSNLSAS